MSSQKNVIKYGDYNWIPWKNNQTLPENVLRVGTDVGYQEIYIGRVSHDNHELPAKVIGDAKRAFTSYDGKEHEKNDAFLLVDDGNFFWEFEKGGKVPETAVKCGKLNNCEDVFVGCALHNGSDTPGAIYPAKGVLRIPFAKGEVEFKEYYVLCHKAPSNEGVVDPERRNRWAELFSCFVDCLLSVKK